jgi:hypothetical protein
MAIFQDQPINLQTIRGVSPERFVQRAERQQQAIVGDFLRMQQGIQAGIQEFEQKRAEKQNMQASLQLLKELGAVEGLSDESIKAGIKNAGGATNFLKTIAELSEAQQRTAPIEVKDIGMGRGAAVQGDRVLQVFPLPGEGDEGKTAAIRNYEYFVGKGMPEDEARKLFFGDEESTASALSKFLSGDDADKEPKDGAKSVKEPEVEVEAIEAPKAPVLSARQRAVQEMQARERSERPTGPMEVTPGLTEEQQKRYEELLRKKQGL